MTEQRNLLKKNLGSIGNYIDSIVNKFSFAQIAYDSIPYLKDFIKNNSVIIPLPRKFYDDKSQEIIYESQTNLTKGHCLGELENLVKEVEDVHSLIGELDIFFSYQRNADAGNKIVDLGQRLSKYQSTLAAADFLRGSDVDINELNYLNKKSQLPDYVNQLINGEQKRRILARFNGLKGKNREELKITLGITEKELKELFDEVNLSDPEEKVLNLNQFDVKCAVNPFIHFYATERDFYLCPSIVSEEEFGDSSYLYLAAKDVLVDIPEDLEDQKALVKEQIYSEELGRIKRTKERHGLVN